MKKTMKALVWDKELRLREDYPIPRPGKGEALIRVLMAGICNTDVEITRGYMGFRGVLGHEFVGVVEEAEGAGGKLIGRRVVGDINCACGTCPYCLKGMRTHCPHRTTLGIAARDGAFAEYLTLPVENLLEVPSPIPDEAAVFAEPLAAAFKIAEGVHIRPTDRILVMGDGKLGILCALALGLTQARVALVGKHEKKLEIGRTCRIETVNAAEMGPERLYDVVVEATGRADGIETALTLVKPRGTVVLKSTVAGGNGVDLTPLVIDEIRLVGSRCGPFAPALRALAKGEVDVRPLITGILPFEDALHAFVLAKQPETLKVLLDFRQNR